MTGIDFEKLTSIAIFMVGLYLTSATFDFFASFIMATSANKLANGLRTNISKKINMLPLRYFDKHAFGDILSRVTNDVDTIGMSVSQNLGSFTSAVALLIASVVMMFYTNWIMALTAILTSLIGFAGMFAILRKIAKIFQSKTNKIG